MYIIIWLKLRMCDEEVCVKLSKKYLESISTEELLKISEIYGLFIPNNLDRSFIIQELLELADGEDDAETREKSSATLSKFIEEKEAEELEPEDLESDLNFKKSKKMKISYSSTEVHLLLRDPMWLFAFWDFSKNEFKKITADLNFDTFVLRVFLYKENNKEDPYDYYDIEIDPNDRSRYFYLSFDDVLTRVAIGVRYIDENINIIAQSNCIHLRRSNIPKKLCKITNESESIEKLSGLSLLKKSHFKNYRQAFRNNEERYFEE